ncbi:hypothetical protein [Rhodococcus sp. 14-1411-2a]|uniref:hypothetical protein n=1 Tax=Rhodococcus sp. 14-1411-2a TaxID=2023151 RepID=UPI000B9B41A7|nr:hypothetical protein [Rhodococcus sp. 14-1411-2a]OZF44727.1 hypothetical protein CH291_20565 [Rhodococcus sp. 14-1411-2a]
MTYTSTQVTRRPAPTLRTADVAGIAWPVYKLEALALGLLVFAATLVIAGSLQAAVLAGAAVAVVAWWMLRLTELGSTGPASARQAARPQ